MEHRVKISSKPRKLIKVSSLRLKRLDRDQVAEALGAQLIEAGVPESVLGARGHLRNGNGKPRA